VEFGNKDDADKPDLSLLSPIWINGIGKVLNFGAKKYATYKECNCTPSPDNYHQYHCELGQIKESGKNNWRKGIALSRLLAAALRHIFAFIGGEDKDPETKFCHLDHASVCLMFAREIWETRPDLDDRYKIEKAKV
jgi:hypothetical protein